DSCTGRAEREAILEVGRPGVRTGQRPDHHAGDRQRAVKQPVGQRGLPGDMNHSERIRSLVGAEIVPSRWIEISQQLIDTFADATLDHQWIHVDPERAKQESPFGGTVAHGMLTLSMAPRLALEQLELTEAKIVINYGLNKVRFPAAVPAGSEV